MQVLSLAFALSILTAAYAVVILFGAACTNGSWQIYYISDQLAQCNDNPSYVFVPWLFAWSLVIQVYCLLYTIRKLHTQCCMPDRLQDINLHLMVFHLIFCMASVVEFRNDEKLKQKNEFLFIRDLDELTIHAYAAMWTFVEFCFLHAVLCQTYSSMCILDIQTSAYHRRCDKLYAFVVLLFVLFWFLQLHVTAKIIEWILLLLAALLQLFAYNVYRRISSGKDHQYITLQQNDAVFFSFFNNQHALLWFVLVVGISLNFLLVLIVLAPPAWDTWTMSKTDPNKAPYMQVTLNFVLLTSVAAFLVILDWLFWTNTSNTQQR